MKHVSETGQPCDADGNFLPFDSPPPIIGDDNETPYAPFKDREAFKFAELMFTKAETSKGNLDALLDIWGRRNISQGLDEDATIFSNAKDMFEVIDSIQHGDAPWKSIWLKYNGPVDNNSPTWQRVPYEFILRDTRTVVKNMLEPNNSP